MLMKGERSKEGKQGERNKEWEKGGWGKGEKKSVLSGTKKANILV